MQHVLNERQPIVHEIANLLLIASRINNSLRGAVQKLAGLEAAMARRQRFLKDERGATAVEYGLIVSLIFIAIVIGVANYANRTGNMYNYINNSMKGS